jgi:hypothetical protein
MEKLLKAEEKIKQIERIAYLTYPLLKEKVIAIKILKEMKEVVKLLLETVLERESKLQRIKLTNNPQKNLNLFFNRCLKNYSLNESSKKTIIEILKLNAAIKKSPMIFKRKEEIIITTKEMNYGKINEKFIKKLLRELKIIQTLISDKIRKI